MNEKLTQYNIKKFGLILLEGRKNIYKYFTSAPCVPEGCVYPQCASLSKKAVKLFKEKNINWEHKLLLEIFGKEFEKFFYYLTPKFSTINYWKDNKNKIAINRLAICIYCAIDFTELLDF